MLESIDPALPAIPFNIVFNFNTCILVKYIVFF